MPATMPLSFANAAALRSSLAYRCHPSRPVTGKESRFGRARLLSLPWRRP